MILFLGIAGSGKSTQGHLLAAHLHCPWVSTGNLLREKADAATQKRMLRGEIISDEETLAVLDEEFRRIDASQNQFVLDGSPRTMRQAKWLVEKSKNGELKITAAVHLTIDQSAAHDRLISRQRPDDHEAAIAERFSEYEQNIKPIINYLKAENFKVYNVEGNDPPAKVAADICKILGV